MVYDGGVILSTIALGVALGTAVASTIVLCVYVRRRQRLLDELSRLDQSTQQLWAAYYKLALERETSEAAGPDISADRADLPTRWDRLQND